jgi:hypothetical protein
MDKGKAGRDLRVAKKTFNVITNALIDQLLCLFADNGTLRFLKEELQRFASDPRSNHVPAVKYFKTMNLATKVEPKAVRGPLPEESTIVVGELIIRNDPVIFTDAVGVKIPELEALGMQEKWPLLSKTNQDIVWDYLVRMAKTSAQVVIGMQMVDGTLPNVVQQLTEKGVQAHPGMTEAEFTKFAEEVKLALPSK